MAWQWGTSHVGFSSRGFHSPHGFVFTWLIAIGKFVEAVETRWQRGNAEMKRERERERMGEKGVGKKENGRGEHKWRTHGAQLFERSGFCPRAFGFTDPAEFLCVSIPIYRVIHVTRDFHLLRLRGGPSSDESNNRPVARKFPIAIEWSFERFSVEYHEQCVNKVCTLGIQGVTDICYFAVNRGEIMHLHRACETWF